MKSPTTWKADLHEIYIIFDELPLRINEDINSFGVFVNVLPQLQEIVDRLTQNKFALLRTVGEYTAIFYIFEPIGEKVLFSTYNKLPYEYLSYFPLEKSPMFFMDGRNQKKLLYDFVEADKIMNYPDNSQHAINTHVKNFELNYLSLIADLKKQIELGDLLIKL